MNYIYDKESRCLVKGFSCDTVGLHVERTRDWDKAMELDSEAALEVEGFLCGMVDCEKYRSVDSEAFRSAEAAFDVASARGFETASTPEGRLTRSSRRWSACAESRKVSCEAPAANLQLRVRRLRR